MSKLNLPDSWSPAEAGWLLDGSRRVSPCINAGYLPNIRPYSFKGLEEWGKKEIKYEIKINFLQIN